MELAGKTALITGGARRIGEAVVRTLADQKVGCVIHYGHSAKNAEELASELKAAGTPAHVVQGDLADPDDVARIWTSAVAMAGPIDMLINNASIFPEAPLASLCAQNLLENLRVNTLAPFQLAQLFHASGHRGVIVNFLDTMVRDYDRKHVPYHISKRVLHDLTRMMAVEFAPQLRVNAVAPGLVLPPVGKDISYLEGLKHSNLLETYGSAEQVAHATMFLLSNEFVTGQTIYVDGGRNLRGSMYE